jgi:hypothetical protein
MKVFSLSALESFNRFLNLIVGVAVITSVVGVLDYFYQYAHVSYDLQSPGAPGAVWVNESAVVKYYMDHNYKMSDVITKYLRRDHRLWIPSLEDAEAGRFSNYPKELSPSDPDYEHFEIEKKLRLQSYHPFSWGVGMVYPGNCDEWIDQILPEVRKLSETEQRVLELAILSARRVESTIWIKNDGDLIARDIKVYINAVPNLASGGKGSILSIMSIKIPTVRSRIYDYHAEFDLPVLKPKDEVPIMVITRESPIFSGSISLDYETQRVVRSGKLAIFFLILMVSSLAIVMVFALKEKINSKKSADNPH